MMTPEFEIRLLKFADDDLSLSDEADVLAECEMHPERYRDLALALCESRRLGAVLSGTNNPAVRAVPRTTSPRSRGWSGWTLATASCLALAIGIAGGRFLPSLSSQSPPGLASPGTSVEAAEPQYVVLYADPANERPPTDDWPAEAQELVSQSLQPWFQPAEREVLRRHGYELHEEPTLYVVADDQGNQVAIAQRDLQIRHVSN